MLNLDPSYPASDLLIYAKPRPITRSNNQVPLISLRFKLEERSGKRLSSSIDRMDVRKRQVSLTTVMNIEKMTTESPEQRLWST
ncbi:hypothetical protein WG66_011652 [Moniliophthora roreri]|nr:hypothetical protein WG66_011652 [Moniliophthora roreri]